MSFGGFDAIKVGTGEDLVTLTRWVIAQQQVNLKKKSIFMVSKHIYT